MSSILKSLRKIEEEKRGAGHAAPDLRVDQGFVPAKSKQLLPLLTGLTLGAVIVGLFFLWPSKPTLPDVKNQPLSIVKNQPPTNANEAVPAVKPEPKTSDVIQEERVVTPVTTDNSSRKADLVEPSKTPVVTLPSEPVTATEDNSKIAPVAVSKPSVKKEQAPDVSKVASKSTTSIQTPPVAIVAPTAPTVSTELPEGVSLLVTEIFFQDDSNNSMAVVNDLPVMIGTQVDAATVTEIHPDRVLFKLDGKTYTVLATN